MITSIEQTAFNLGVATLLGACIGFERQWRQRMAGLRTNTLVAIGAASFVVFESLFPDDGSPTRVAAQVVSGIGFLGAGIIFREGLQVSGLNTAATLWCSAAVGLLAGSGHPLHAAAGAPHNPTADRPDRALFPLQCPRRLPQSRGSPCPRPAAAGRRQRPSQP